MTTFENVKDSLGGKLCAAEISAEDRESINTALEEAFKLGAELFSTQSVMQPWTLKCSKRMQAVLIAAVRGCDGAPKEDPSKFVLWALRADVLRPADPSYDLQNPRGFMGYVPELTYYRDVFLKSLDQYPFHFVMHLTHAAEIIGHYYDPDGTGLPNKTRHFWFDFYQKIAVENCHMQPETLNDLERRLAD